MNNEAKAESVTYDFVRNPLYREIYADGVWGGVHPGGYIQMVIFKDKSYLPSSVEYSVQEGGRLEESDREMPDRITRELEADVRMSLKAAILMRDWLTARIDQLGS